MKKYIIALAVVVPAIEIAGIYFMVQWVGIWATIALMIVTSILGILLARKEGLQAVRLMKMQARSGQPPTGAVLDGICIFLGALCLFLPGFFTDLLGLLLFLPFSRAAVKALAVKWMYHLFQKGQIIVRPRR
ncbi:FxsA family protein [Alkalihalobacillus sp. FSL W8-0930]